MSNEFEGRVAIVTGSAGGIGRASAMAFARRGATVVVADRYAAGGAETIELIMAEGGSAEFVELDVTDPESVASVMSGCVERHGRLDYAHNNAGVLGVIAELHADEEANWAQVISVNLSGVWRCMSHEIRHMLAQGKGAIVNTASVLGEVAAPGLAPYVASKHGVIGLTRAAALDYAARGIRVNAVSPGTIRTQMVLSRFDVDPTFESDSLAAEPIGRFGEPSEVGDAVAWLCSDAASFVTGVALPVDGGLLLHN
jgi:NAD(P)-dependent dehydrogenase (short-subunit alcohol dehydrogenase family)